MMRAEPSTVLNNSGIFDFRVRRNRSYQVRFDLIRNPRWFVRKREAFTKANRVAFSIYDISIRISVHFLVFFISDFTFCITGPENV